MFVDSTHEEFEVMGLHNLKAVNKLLLMRFTSLWTSQDPYLLKLKHMVELMMLTTPKIGSTSMTRGEPVEMIQVQSISVKDCEWPVVHLPTS